MNNVRIFDGKYFFSSACRYKLDNTSAGPFLLSVNFSACFESNGDCLLNFPIMVYTKFPMVDCNFKNQSFAKQGTFVQVIVNPIQFKRINVLVNKKLGLFQVLILKTF